MSLVSEGDSRGSLLSLVRLKLLETELRARDLGLDSGMWRGQNMFLEIPHLSGRSFVLSNREWICLIIIPSTSKTLSLVYSNPRGITVHRAYLSGTVHPDQTHTIRLYSNSDSLNLGQTQTQHQVQPTWHKHILHGMGCPGASVLVCLSPRNHAMRYVSSNRRACL